MLIHSVSVASILAIITLLGYIVGAKQKLNNPPEKLYYLQPLDHFGSGNLSTILFNQRYFLDRTHWAGPKSETPLIVYFGGESPIDTVLQKLGVLSEAAPKFKALVMYIEHRFYGLSVPFGSIDIAFGDEKIRGCLTSDQALADFATIIINVKKRLMDKQAPVIVIGCSYSGMLAAWFRLKYPHVITIGALASSAPIYYFDKEMPWEYEYCSVVSRDYKVVNEKCYKRIRKSWEMIDKIGLQRDDGHLYLATLFKTCSPFISIEGLKSTLVSMFSFYAQYNGRYDGLINSVCDEIVRAPDDDILGGVARSITNGAPCLKVEYFGILDSNSSRAWNWQLCNEFIFHQGCGNDTMFQPSPFNLTERIEWCKSIYHVSPRLNWISIHYGGYKEMQSTLKNIGSNIIFSNGLMDPFSPFGVLEDLSETVVSLTTEKGSHCLDINPELQDDPKWLKHQREKELKIFSRWIKNSPSPTNIP